MGKNSYENPDAVRNAIPSHNLMLVSLPREVSMRAGIQKGVQVRVDQNPKTPEIITLEVLNPVDLSAELKEYVDRRKGIADRKTAKAQRKADHAKKLAASAKKKKAAEKKEAAAQEPEEQPDATDEEEKPEEPAPA